MFNKIKSLMLVSTVLLAHQSSAFDDAQMKAMLDVLKPAKTNNIGDFAKPVNPKSKARFEKEDKEDKKNHYLEYISSGISEAISQVVAQGVSAISASGNSSATAQAAGQSDAVNGVWAKAIFGGNKSQDNFKLGASFVGGSIGYQALVAEDSVVGAAFTLVNMDAKRDGEKFMGTNYYIGSIYAASKMDSVLLSGAAFFGSGSGKFSDKVSDKIYGKAKDTVYGINAGLGYEVVEGQNVITPFLGLKWIGLSSKIDKMNDKNNLNVLNGSIGVKYGYMIENNDFTVVPSVNIGCNSNFVNTFKEGDKKVSLADGQKTKFFTGVDLTAKGQSVDFGVGGKFEMAKKYNAYTASVSVLAKF